MKGLQKKRKGFTLIELVVVIVIIAILAAVAMLSFGNFTQTAKDSRIKQEHAQLIAAGNMWRAAQEHPEYAPPNLKALEPFLETKRPILPDHTLIGGQLLSPLSGTQPALEYNFGVVDPDWVEPEP